MTSKRFFAYLVSFAALLAGYLLVYAYRARGAEDFAVAIPLVASFAGLLFGAIAILMFLIAWRLGSRSGRKAPQSNAARTVQPGAVHSSRRPKRFAGLLNFHRISCAR
jgi:hypothetical protein